MTLTAHQIDNESLYDICTTLATLVLTDKYKIDGSLLALLIKRLIAAEVQPGGPYRNKAGKVDVATNLAIGYLFLCLKKPLPAVIKFINETPEADKQSLPLYKQYLAIQANRTAPSHEAEGIYTTAETTLGKLALPVRESALTFLARVKRADKHYEIALLASRFYQSLQKPLHAQYNATLGEANIYCWIAYTIYDHLIDDEAVTKYLPVANIAMRLSIERYASIFPPNHPFVKTIQKTFTEMDNANAWELAHCRFTASESHLLIGKIPAYRQYLILARRSFGHALGPFALASLSGGRPSQLKDVQKGLSHYLILRQLNDDMHDWRKDMRNGHISPVVALLIRQASLEPGAYSLEMLAETLTPLFWDKTVNTMNKIIHKHTEMARQHLEQSRLLKDKADFFHFITRLDSVATSAPIAHEQYQSLLTNVKHII